MDEFIKKMQSIHIVEYYSALKREEILTQVTAGMNLEDMMLRERSQSPKDQHLMIPLTGGPWESQVHGDRKPTGHGPGG